ncbi:PREDICTED: putative fatty acyl-CoA reductase CG5065 [Acromyrmex echinatior]|uniref:putative fatty acyl-CoA reductase CG5065 n=1 Tax=Acromyrmex echinatior TaxID=103372 RepID=UPI000580F3EA|nr:PREDICTED: putative fatty acyl-CoA reductase CG5065 [Acromyrmex echinatior]
METGDRYRTPIQDFYADTTIFITGGTGFLGKMLIEKLLRSCPDISMIYVMVRSQKDKSPENRLDEMLESPLYDRVKKEVPNFHKKIVPIIGDSNIKDLGLSESDRNMLISKVSIIFHMAANMQFYGKIKISTIVNIDATATILKLAKRMPNLKSFIHVSLRFILVISSASEPLIGWIDNIYGPSGIATSLLLGIVRFHRCNGNLKANIVPVDFTVNALIASAWDVHKQHRRAKDMLIYNFVSPIDGPTWNEYNYALLDNNKMYPLHNAIYLPLMTFFKHEIPYRFCVWFGHFLPALLLDGASICIGRRPRMWKLYMKMDKFCKAMEPFCNTEWTYSTDNIHSMWDNLNEKDQQLFQFNMVEFNWTEYLINHYQGLRRYQLNENDSMLKVSRMKYVRLYWIHQIIKTIFFFVIFWIIWFMFIEMFE